MCGRYFRRSDKQRIADAFKLRKLPPDFVLRADYNIAPSTFQPVIRPNPESGERELVLMRWGLVPAKLADPDAFKTFTTTNARAESILDKPIWRGPFQQTRCWSRSTGSMNGCNAPVCLSRRLLSLASTASLVTSVSRTIGL
jgi:putative SOS response-associated peptidase YedK